jgi:HK97 gp10 family phage protein
LALKTEAGGYVSIIMEAMGDPLTVLAALDDSIDGVVRKGRWSRYFATEVAKQAKEYAPDSRTSDKDQKKPKVGRHLKSTIKAGNMGGGGYQWGVKVGEGLDRPYAYFQEMGTRKHEAHPFLRPAVAAVLARNDMSLAKEIWSNSELRTAMITPVIRPVSVSATASFAPGTAPTNIK